MITSERLKQIRDADQMAGADLQFCPSTWTDRRDLLEHIRTLEEAAELTHLASMELSTMLEPISQGATTPAELVARMRLAAELRAAMQEAPE